MDRITGTAVADIGGGKRGFQDEILATGEGSQEGTVVTANWLNAVQEEVLNVIEESGQVPDNGDLTQLSQAIDAFIVRAFVNNQSLASSGWCKLPGGLIIQWSAISILTDTSSSTASWPITFPAACLAAFVTRRSANPPDYTSFPAVNPGQSQFTVQSVQAVGGVTSYYVLGFGV